MTLSITLLLFSPTEATYKTPITPKTNLDFKTVKEPKKNWIYSVLLGEGDIPKWLRI